MFIQSSNSCPLTGSCLGRNRWFQKRKSFRLGICTIRGIKLPDIFKSHYIFMSYSYHGHTHMQKILHQMQCNGYTTTGVLGMNTRTTYACM